MATHPTRRRSWTSVLIAFLALVVLLCATTCQAQETSTTTTTTTTIAASIFPGTTAWAYQGCYNETTTTNGTNGLRALSAVSFSDDEMSVPKCLDLCAGGNYAFAGVEYTRECYCARYLSSLSTKLPDTTCNLPCKGNSSQICGGALSLSVYHAKSSKEGSGIKVVREAPVGSVLALGIAIGVSLCLA